MDENEEESEKEHESPDLSISSYMRSYELVSRFGRVSCRFLNKP
jgi:hypothetical protein